MAGIIVVFSRGGQLGLVRTPIDPDLTTLRSAKNSLEFDFPRASSVSGS